MRRATIVLAIGLTLCSRRLEAQSRDDDRAGTPGHVSAWEADRITLIAVEACPVTREGAWDYGPCGAAFRASVARWLCATRGPGEHRWFYQVGDSAMLAPTPTRCRW